MSQLSETGIAEFVRVVLLFQQTQAPIKTAPCNSMQEADGVQDWRTWSRLISFISFRLWELGRRDAKFSAEISTLGSKKALSAGIKPPSSSPVLKSKTKNSRCGTSSLPSGSAGATLGTDLRLSSDTPSRNGNGTAQRLRLCVREPETLSADGNGRAGEEFELPTSNNDRLSP